MKLKKRYLCILLFFFLLSCAHNHPLSQISKSAMNQILVFVSEHECMSSYTYDSETQIYQLKIEADKSQIEELLMKPIALCYLFSIPGMGQKIGLTDCQDPFIMIKSDPQLLNKVLNLFSDEEIARAYQKALEHDLLK